ncbi:MAG: hypothetical protein ABH951_02510 [Patescibacteria group bacterium]
MDIKDLNKAQLVMLLVLITFVVSIATSIITTSLMQEAPASVSLPINRVIRETVEKIVPVNIDTKKEQALSEEQKKLLEELKAIKPLTVNLFLKGETEDKDKILGTGLFLGDNKVVIASLIDAPKEGEIYIVKSILGEQKVSNVTQEKDFTVIELAEAKIVPDPILDPENPENTPPIE